MNFKFLLASVCVFLVALLGANYYIDTQNAEMHQILSDTYSEQYSALLVTADHVFTNTADSGVNTYVGDCPGPIRNQFDAKLDSLGNLSVEELSDTALLFEACASYFADRKSAMVDKLLLQYKTTKEVHGVLSVIDGSKRSELDTEKWEAFIGFEQQRAELLRAQLPIQEQIIALLKSGLSQGADEIQENVAKAQEIAETAVVVTKQTSSVYNELK